MKVDRADPTRTAKLLEPSPVANGGGAWHGVIAHSL